MVTPCRFYPSFCFFKKKQKRARKTITSRFPETAMFNFCTTVTSALVILLLVLNSSVYIRLFAF